MGKDRNQREGPENQTNSDTDEKKFNAGGNSSDYDGGHPKNARKGSDGRIDGEK